LTAVLLSAASLIAAANARPFADPRSEHSESIDNANANDPRDPACYEPRFVSAGAPAPKNPHTLAVRWGGFSNYELVYNEHIILLDAYYDRGSFYPPLGVKAADFKRADVILIGHGHLDHMSDAAQLGSQTGAPVVGGPPTAEKLRTQSIPAAQIKEVTGKGGELLKFDGFTVEPILGRHGEPDPRLGRTLADAVTSLVPPMTEAQKTEAAAIRAKGTGGPRVITEGTIAYLITFDDGFRVMYRDSAGIVTDYEKAAMARVGRVDLAITALRADLLPSATIPQEMEYMNVYRPSVVMPAHHDAGNAQGTDGHIWRSTEPVFQALKDANPSLVTVSRGYREPTCFNTEINVSHGG
jgi:L-ascorbate metabolism protein UlaG (beta-lactamase superfamily)